MISVSDDVFEQLIDEAIASLPRDHLRAVENVAFVYADEPTPEQRVQLQLRHAARDHASVWA